MSTNGTESKSVGLEGKLRAQDLLYAQMFHDRERKPKLIALGVAIVLHVVVLLLNFPEFKKTIEQKKENVIVVKKYVPPPPKIERQEIVQQKLTRKVPIPDPTPDEPEPIREPEPEITPEPLPPDVEILIGVPEPPPPSGPLIAGSQGVSNPVLIPESKVQPEFPELARVARIDGRVFLQAVIHKDGTVGEITVLSCSRPNMGFEESAMAAVVQWRYQPAMQGNRPVDVYFTVRLEFILQ